MSSLALLLLGTWLIASLLFLRRSTRTVREWLRTPLGAVPMALFVIIGFYHGLDGLKVVVDDYVHEAGNNFALNTAAAFAAVGGRPLRCSRSAGSHSEPQLERLQDHRSHV